VERRRAHNVRHDKKEEKEMTQNTVMAKCFKCDGYTKHYIFGTRAVCTGCGDEKRLCCLKVLEFLPLKQGGSEKRV